MVIVRDFEKHKYNLPVHNANAPSGSSIHGAGIIDTESQNKDTSVSSAFSNIAQAIKAAKHYNELREASKLSPKVISELQTERNKKGDGFEKF